MLFSSHWWLSVVGVIELWTHGQRGMMRSLPAQRSGQSSGETGDEKNCCCCHRNNHHQVPVSLTLLRSREDIRGQRSREAIFTIFTFMYSVLIL